MSRSRKKTAIGKSAYSSREFSERDFKTSYNRKIRRKVSRIMTSYHLDDIEDMILPQRDIEFGDVWNSKTDGRKRYFGDLKLNKIEYDSWYRIDYKNSKNIKITMDNRDQAIRENNLEHKRELIVWHIEMWDYYYHWSRVSYILYETMDEKIVKNKTLYAEKMRK